jgi:hypothetical protein
MALIFLLVEEEVPHHKLYFGKTVPFINLRGKGDAEKPFIYKTR